MLFIDVGGVDVVYSSITIRHYNTTSESTVFILSANSSHDLSSLTNGFQEFMIRAAMENQNQKENQKQE